MITDDTQTNQVSELKIENNTSFSNNLDLSSLSLEQLAAQYIDINRQSHILRGKI